MLKKKQFFNDILIIFLLLSVDNLKTTKLFIMDGYDKKEGAENNTGNVREEIFSKVVRAGKRTYFLDVKATRRNDYYLTITESKKRFNRDGRHYFEKHKIFLYKEDFEKFTDNLHEVIEFIKENIPEQTPLETEETAASVEVSTEVTAEVPVEAETVKAKGYSSDVEFDDLGNSNE
jgi:hypothetical protein